MRREAGIASEVAEVETVAAAGIDNDVALSCGQHPGDTVEQRLGHAAIMQSPPRRQRCHRVAGLFGTPLLGLQQVDVSATRDIERMSARTEHAPLRTLQRQMA